MTKSNNLEILFVGDLNKFSRSWQRFNAIKNLGYSVFPISWSSGFRFNFLEKMFYKLRIPIDVSHVNKEIRKTVRNKKFDIFWIEKGNTIKPKTLKYLKEKFNDSKLISLSEDDMYAYHNRSFFYTKGLRYYDVVFTTKTYNLEELKKIGAGKTELFLDAYDEAYHRPVSLTQEEKEKFCCDVSFIGTFETDRALRILYLAENGVKVVVWGNGWNHWVSKNKNLIVKGEDLQGEDYVKAICGTKVNLCFLRKINRDEITSRSVEIPACGGFMLGERTNRHLDFLKEGEEAEFFDSNEEMIQKTKYYIQNDDLRKKIGLTGRERCKKSGYSQREQMKKILSLVCKEN